MEDHLDIEASEAIPDNLYKVLYCKVRKGLVNAIQPTRTHKLREKNCVQGLNGFTNKTNSKRVFNWFRERSVFSGKTAKLWSYELELSNLN